MGYPGPQGPPGTPLISVLRFISFPSHQRSHAHVMPPVTFTQCHGLGWDVAGTGPGVLRLRACSLWVKSRCEDP